MNIEEIAKELGAYSGDQLEAFEEKVVEKKFTSTLINPFVSSRQLNYWLNEAKLLPEYEDKGWRKFSFLELVWLKIVNDLRDFGVDFEVLKKLYEDLFFVTSTEDLFEEIHKRKDQILSMLEKDNSKSAKLFRELTTKINEVKRIIPAEKKPLILFYIMHSITLKSPGNILIKKNGEHLFMVEKLRDYYKQNDENRAFIFESHISVSISDVIEYYILKEDMDRGIVNEILTEDEQSIINTIRKEKPESINVKFDKMGKATMIEVTRQTRVELAHRLADIILKNEYQTIVLKTQKGKIVTCTSTKKIKR